VAIPPCNPPLGGDAVALDHHCATWLAGISWLPTY
jgi:hypothetical protein